MNNYNLNKMKKCELLEYCNNLIEQKEKRSKELCLAVDRRNKDIKTIIDLETEIYNLKEETNDFELLEENERLKNKIDILENLDSFDLYKENQKLKDENDILKKTIKIIK